MACLRSSNSSFPYTIATMQTSSCRWVQKMYIYIVYVMWNLLCALYLLICLLVECDCVSSWEGRYMCYGRVAQKLGFGIWLSPIAQLILHTSFLINRGNVDVWDRHTS